MRWKPSTTRRFTKERTLRSRTRRRGTRKGEQALQSCIRNGTVANSPGTNQEQTVYPPPTQWGSFEEYGSSESDKSDGLTIDSQSTSGFATTSSVQQQDELAPSTTPQEAVKDSPPVAEVIWDPHANPVEPMRKNHRRDDGEKTMSHFTHDILEHIPDIKVLGKTFSLKRANPYEMDEVTDMMAGEYYGKQGENAEGCVGGGTINTRIPLSANKHRTIMLEKLRMREKKAGMPILASEVSDYLKTRHGILAETSNNRNLIRADAAKFVTSLYLSERAPYAGLAWKDIAPIVEFGALLFWIPSYDEVTCEVMRQQFSRQIATRASWATPPDT